MPHFGLTFFFHFLNEEHEMEFSLSKQVSTIHRPFTWFSTNIKSLGPAGGSTNDNKSFYNSKTGFSQNLIFSQCLLIKLVIITIFIFLFQLLTPLPVPSNLPMKPSEDYLSICSFCLIHIPTCISAHILHLPFIINCR